MSFKKFSTAQDTPSKAKSDDRFKDAPMVDQPPAPPEKAPSDVKRSTESWHRKGGGRGFPRDPSPGRRR